MPLSFALVSSFSDKRCHHCRCICICSVDLHVLSPLYLLVLCRHVVSVFNLHFFVFCIRDSVFDFKKAESVSCLWSLRFSPRRNMTFLGVLVALGLKLDRSVRRWCPVFTSLLFVNCSLSFHYGVLSVWSGIRYLCP